MDKLIKDTLQVLKFCGNELKNKTREDYLISCNTKWLRMFDNIKKMAVDNEKRLLKDSVRVCYLVRFLTEEQRDNNVNEKDFQDPVAVKLQKYGFYDFNDTYGCFLNIIKCTMSQYIGSTRVSYMIQQANRIIKELLDYYAKWPRMLSYSQRKRYPGDISKPAEPLSAGMYCIVDHIAGMTDRMAKKKFDELQSSEAKWSNEYGNIII